MNGLWSYKVLQFAHKQNIFVLFCSLYVKYVPKLNRNRGPKTEVQTEPWANCTVAPLQRVTGTTHGSL